MDRTTYTEKFTDTDMGGSKGQYVFLSFPFLHSVPVDDMDALADALVTGLGFEYSSLKISNDEREEKGKIQSSRFDFIEQVDEQTFRYKIKIVGAKGRSMMLVVVDTGSSPDFSEVAEDLFESFRFTGANRDLLVGKSKSLSKAELETEAGLVNGVGLYYFKSEHYNKSLVYFRKASEMVPTYATYLLNALNCFGRSNNPQKGLPFLEKRLDGHRDNLEIMSWYAWLLKENGKSQEAASNYLNNVVVCMATQGKRQITRGCF